MGKRQHKKHSGPHQIFSSEAQGNGYLFFFFPFCFLLFKLFSSFQTVASFFRPFSSFYSFLFLFISLFSFLPSSLFFFLSLSLPPSIFSPHPSHYLSLFFWGKEVVAYILLKSQSLAVKIILFPYSSRTSMPFAQSTAMLSTTTKIFSFNGVPHSGFLPRKFCFSFMHSRKCFSCRS